MVTAVLTPAAGKRLIAKALVRHPVIQSALNSGTVVIVAGTTNGYVAEEMLSYIGQLDGFQRKYFFRGIVLPPIPKDTQEGDQLDRKEPLQDVIICQGNWLKEKTIYDVVDSLKPGDVILKGANAFDPLGRRAAILIGHPEGGTILVALRAVIGKRVHLIIPVGLEKRVFGNLDMLAAKMNASGNTGPRLFPVVGEIFTEIEALSLLAGVSSQVVAAGGVNGAEGAVWLCAEGSTEQEKLAQEILNSVCGEPPFTL